MFEAPGVRNSANRRRRQTGRLIASRRSALTAAAIFTLFAADASSQSLIPHSRETPIVARVSLKGSLKFSKPAHLQHIQTRPNRNFLGIPGTPIWLWLYSLGEAGCCFGERVEQTLRQSGEAPAYLDLNSLESDAERLALFYQREGYLKAKVTTSIDTLSPLIEIGVNFHIDAGRPTYIRRVSLTGLDHLSDDQKRRLSAQSSISRFERIPDPPLDFPARDQRYSESLLLNERRKLVSFLRDEGYARVARDSIRAFVSSPAPDSFDVRIDVNTGARYKFGDVAIHVEGPERSLARVDTLVSPGDDSNGWIVAEVENEGRLDPEALLSAIHFRPGEWFNQSKLLASKRRMESMGIFTFTDFIPRWDAEQALSARATAVDSFGVLPYEVQLQTRNRHQLRVESFVLQRTEVLGDETGGDELGLGLGSTYRNASLLGGGELFQLGASGSIASNLESYDPFQTAQAEVEASVTYPYLWWPFRGLDRRLNLYEARSRIGLRWLTARREALFLTIHARASLLASLEMRHSPTLTSFISLVDFELSDPDTLDGFADQFLAPIDDPVEQESILEDFSRPQVNNAVRYTLRSSNANLFLRNRGHVIEGSVEVGGNLPYFLDRIVFTPDTIEGSLPGIPLFKRGGETSRLVYRQYVRLRFDFRRYKEMGDMSVLAWKAIAGVVQPIGGANVAPFDRRFYSGGAASVRGWGLRELGPGRIAARDSLITGGDIKIELSAEARNVILRSVMKADWISALFVDVGNVWYGPRNPGDSEGRFRLDSFYKELGVSAGLGLRLGWDYLIVRFDLAFQISDPGRSAQSGGFSDPRFHFGIGHAF
ncbi:MAG TPA: BamA/TamA family outer membrane protein [Rhodothermales bacterium]|nr:BamA/TamA family outer membrane protein [Rhodothermales bacterium]